MSSMSTARAQARAEQQGTALPSVDVTRYLVHVESPVTGASLTYPYRSLDRAQVAVTRWETVGMTVTLSVQ